MSEPPRTPRAGLGEEPRVGGGTGGPHLLQTPRFHAPGTGVQAAPESLAWLSLLSLCCSPVAAAAACSNQQIRQTCVRKSLICAFAIAFIISVMLIAANQVLRSGMK